MDEISHITDIWNNNYRLDWVTPEVLRSKYFKSEYIKAVKPYLLGESFSLGTMRPKPFYYDKYINEGWILGFGYKDERDADHLIEKQIESFNAGGVKKVHFSSFTPEYFLPGADRNNYPRLYEFLSKHGFKTDYEAIAMSLNLEEYEPPVIKTTAAFSVDFINESLKPKLLDFISRNFSSDWFHRAKVVGEKGDGEQICIAHRKGDILGYSMFSGSEGKHWYAPGERFGPFGVSEESRGMGVGTVLLSRTLASMKGRAIKTAFFLWTDEKAARLYSRFGFREKRRFSIMSLEL